MKYVTPFKGEVTEKIALLSDVADIIEKWLKVQTLWTNLVFVFTSGDIAKNMPTEAKLFKTNAPPDVIYDIFKQWKNKTYDNDPEKIMRNIKPDGLAHRILQK